ncbi:MAG: clostripain-related cysteine peptidase [Tannerellaceae bacterium]|nr:clostripain-related cysteine peptidase [Tannerellaceae bacterium]MCD8264813.1 clostripain-related cysteine peptidase [Tannerellaceae bacterium]
MKIFNRILILFIVLCPGCESNHDESLVDENNRTIIVYIGRDNNLSGSEEEKVSSFLEGWNGKNGNLIIYEDLYQASPVLYKIEHVNGVNIKVVLEEFTEENSASSEIFNKRINQVIQLYPGNSYGLIMFSHASGWLPQDMLLNPRSLLEDNGEEMELSEFVAALPDNLFDFIIFEACFTAGIEMAYDLKNKCNYMIGSSAEILSPGFREIYARQINNLFLPEAQLTEFVREAFEWINNQTGAYQSGTLSLIKTSELTALAGWLKEHIDKGKATAIDVASIQYFDRYTYHLFSILRIITPGY